MKNAIEKQERKARKQRLRHLTKNSGGGKFTLPRVVKHGFLGFSRNLWLTMAAIFVMTIALVAVSITVVSKFVLTDTINAIKDDISISVYLRHEAKEIDVDTIAATVGGLSSVTHVAITTPDEAKADQIEDLRQKTDNQDIIDAAIEAPNLFPWIVNVKVVDLNDLSELNDLVATDTLIVRNIDNREFSDDKANRIEAINKIATTTNFIEKAGIVLGAVFAVIAAFIIFNTIRMAIFSRQEEISMMKLIGASKGFIVGPFIIEAILYGLIAGIVTIALIALGVYFATSPLDSYGVVIQPTLDLLQSYYIWAALAVLLLGILIGIISAIFAIKKHLR